ncbi:hypothetical protein D3C83_21000 [compost metagenome]
MQACRGSAGEAPRDQPFQLRRQRDLRHQQQRLASGRKRRVDGVQVDLRLAAAGDAEQQPGAKGAEPVADLRNGLCLGGRQLGSRGSR